MNVGAIKSPQFWIGAIVCALVLVGVSFYILEPDSKEAAPPPTRAELDAMQGGPVPHSRPMVEREGRLLLWAAGEPSVRIGRMVRYDRRAGRP